MNKRSALAVGFILGIAVVIYVLTLQSIKEEPVIIMEDAAIRKLTIDEKIQEAQIILIGKINTELPAKWKFHNEKDTKDVTYKEVAESGSGLFTDYLVSVDQVLKGNLDKKNIRVRTFGGETEHVNWIYSDQPNFIKGRYYLLFLRPEFGPMANVDPGAFMSVNSNTAIYEIVGEKAISADDEWILEHLIAYIEKSLSGETLPSDDLVVETPTLFTDTPVFTPTPIVLLTETPTITP